MNDPQFAVTYCPFKVELILEGKILMKLSQQPICLCLSVYICHWKKKKKSRRWEKYLCTHPKVTI